MRLPSIFGVLLLSILTFIFSHCKTEEIIQHDFVFPEVLFDTMPSDSIFTFLAEDGFDTQLKSGTEIKIPKRALTTFEGQFVKGVVSLYVREYKDAIDLIADGIAMDAPYGIAKTAGGIRLEVYKNEQKLYLDPSKTIDINLACYEKGEEYILYAIDKAENSIDSLGIVSPRINERHVQFERSMRKLAPKIKFPLDEEYFTFSYKGILDVIYNSDLTNVSHPTTQKKMKEYGLRWSSVQVEAFIDFHGKEEFAALMVWKNISKKPFPDWIKNANGRLEVLNKKRYRLVVEDEKGEKKFSTQIEAVIPLKELFSLGPAYWNKDYELKIKEYERAQAHLDEIPSAFRFFKIDRFGTFNWQKSFDEADGVRINAQLKLPKLRETELDAVGLYFISSDLKGVQYYPKATWSLFNLYDDPGARIVSILPNRELYYFPMEKTKEIDFVQLQKMSRPSFLFKMEKASPSFKTKEELRTFIQSLP